MSVISVELPADLDRWVRERAADFGFTPAEMLEHLVILESGLRNADPLGRSLPFRDTLYRQLSLPSPSAAETGRR